MLNLIHKLVMPIILTAFILALAGCEVNVPSVDDAQQAVCNPLQSLSAEVGDLANLDVDATTNDVKELKESVDGSLQTIRSINDRLNTQAITDLLAAYDNMTASIDQLPDNQPLGADLRQQIQDGVAGVQSALGQAASVLNCGE